MGPLENWFFRNSDNLNLRVRLFSHDALMSLGIFDIEVEIEVNQKKYWGRGTSRSKDISLIKGCCEAVERFFLHKNKYANSNGMAVHANKDLAVQSATCELIERDLFLCRFLTGTPFPKVDIADNFLLETQKNLKRKRVGLNFYSMGTLNRISGYLCAIDGLDCDEPFGYILGTAAGDINAAMESAFMEAYRNYANYQAGEALSLKDFLDMEKRTGVDFKEHGQLALNLDYARSLKKAFFSETMAIDSGECFDLKERIEVLNKNESLFMDAPMEVVQVSSGEIQNLFVGSDVGKFINMNRLKQFCQQNDLKFCLHEMPHPFN